MIREKTKIRVVEYLQILEKIALIRTILFSVSDAMLILACFKSSVFVVEILADPNVFYVNSLKDFDL